MLRGVGVSIFLLWLATHYQLERSPGDGFIYEAVAGPLIVWPAMAALAVGFFMAVDLVFVDVAIEAVVVVEEEGGC